MKCKCECKSADLKACRAPFMGAWWYAKKVLRESPSEGDGDAIGLGDAENPAIRLT